jgi:hypothetical protein
MTSPSVHKVLGYSRQRSLGGEIGEEGGCVEGQSVVVCQTSDVLVRSGGDVVCEGAAERVHRWQLVSFRAAARMAGRPPEKGKRDKHQNPRQREKRSKTKTYYCRGVSVITTVEMTMAANGVGGSEEMNEGRQEDGARQS